MSTIVIGIGHPFRRDDAVGWRVAEAMTRHMARMGCSDVTILQHHGEGTDLMARWQGYACVVLVDATCSGATPGETRFWDDPMLVPVGCFPKSSHVFGVAEALTLAADLGRLPPRLRVIGIEGADFSAGDELDVRVEESINIALRLALDYMNAQ